MRKYLVIPLFVLLVLALAAAPLSAASPVAGKTIAVDPGHGGTESGAVFSCSNGTTVYEKDINLAVAQVLQGLLQNDGATVVPTRTGDYDVSLSQRVTIANKAGAQALLSIHHNGASNPSSDWTETYFSQPNDKPLAVAAYNALHAALAPLPGQGAKHSPGFTLTVKPKMPSSITEAYFVTNATEAGYFCGVAPSQYASVQRVQVEAAAQEQGLNDYFQGLAGGRGK